MIHLCLFEEIMGWRSIKPTKLIAFCGADCGFRYHAAEHSYTYFPEHTDCPACITGHRNYLLEQELTR